MKKTKLKGHKPITLRPSTFKALQMMLHENDRHLESTFLWFKAELTKQLPKYATADDYLAELRHRTDISDDDKWEMECLEYVIKAIYLIEGGVNGNPN